MRDEPNSPSDLFRIVSCTPDRSGLVEVVSLVSADAPELAYDFDTPGGDVYAANPQVSARSDLAQINLVEFSGGSTTWRLFQTAQGVRFGVNLSETWTLPGHDTYYLGSFSRDEGEGWEAAAELVDPLSGELIPIHPLADYTFRLLAAAHRCSLKIVATLLDEDGGVVGSHIHEVDGRFRGGANSYDYDAVRLDFTAPAAASKLRVTAVKGRTERREDSFAFFVRPQLQQGREVGDRAEAVRLTRDALARLRASGDMQVERATIAVPGELFRGTSATVDLIVSAAGATQRLGPVLVERVLAVEATRVRLDRSWLQVLGVVNDDRAELRLAVHVDGVPSGSETIPVTEGRFDARLSFAPEHLDGLPHALEVRLSPEQAPIAHVFEILPSRLTPWSSIQTLARSPVDVASSPTARHHLRSYRAWAQANGRTLPVDLAALHDELLQGVQKRDAYPRLTFPSIAAPDVTVVVPAHGKFEVTYHALCSLLFAHNKATFEVVLVDDGSEDATREAERFVEGVRVVRHERALGFVDACNAGAAQSRGRYVAFLNNDTEVTAGWLDELIRAIEAFDDVGLVGSKLIYADGRLQEAGGLIWRSGNPSLVGRGGNAADPRYNYLRQVDYVSGAAVLLPIDLWRAVGGFSPEFAPGYFEDTDLAMKVRAAGKRVVYVPTSTVVHFEGQSAGVDVTLGMKRFQEVNRPKFKRKWGSALMAHGPESAGVDHEKDRGVAFRVLFIDQRCPQLDADAGSYAAFQEIRLLQACGGKVTLLPRNLAWMDRHTLALERIGVECLYAPYVLNFTGYVEEHAHEYDVIYVNRYRVAEQLLPLIRKAAPQAKVLLNLADLHFLRELREAQAKSPGYTLEGARKTRAAELAVIRAVDLTLSYTDVESAVIQSHLDGEGRVARLPWVVDVGEPDQPAFSETRNLLFLGGFGHPPNLQAVKFYASEVWPMLRSQLPELKLEVIGSSPPSELASLAEDHLVIHGQVEDLQPFFRSARIFIAPLLAGAGIKGKVLEAMARGSAMVLSPVAAEGTGLVDGVDCLVADTPQAWAEAVARLYADEALWKRLGEAARQAARSRFGFEQGRRMMEEALMKVDIFPSPGLHYKFARPDSFAG